MKNQDLRSKSDFYPSRSESDRATSRLRSVTGKKLGTSGSRRDEEAASETEREEAGGAAREELVERLRELAQWKNNDVVKLAFLESGDMQQVDGLDLTGVVELKRNPNGTFEAKFVDRVRVLAMLRELLEQREDDRLEEFMDALKRPEDGDEA